MWSFRLQGKHEEFDQVKQQHASQARLAVSDSQQQEAEDDACDNNQVNVFIMRCWRPCSYAQRSSIDDPAGSKLVFITCCHQQTLSVLSYIQQASSHVSVTAGSLHSQHALVGSSNSGSTGWLCYV